jgi:putative ABC transport system permease protein
VVSALVIKLGRDLWAMRGQTLTIALVIASGIAVFVASLSAYHSLVASQADYYVVSRFADVFASSRRAPLALGEQIRAIEGVAEADLRVVEDAVIELPGDPLPRTGRLIGLPPDGRPTLNRLHLLSGRAVEPGARDEALVSAGFAEANRIRPGAIVRARLSGRLAAYTVVGVAVSPEYVYAAAPGDPLPDDRRFGVLWVDGESLATAYDMDGAFDDVAIALAPGASARAVMEELDRLLARYGGLVSYDRSRQTSHQFLSDEIVQQGTMATTIPPIFLLVAAFLLNGVIGRLIGTQREQIAVLKALGYGDREITRHYVGFVVAVVGLGIGLGLGLGLLFGELMMASYRPFFRFPSLDYTLRPWVPLVAASIALGAGLAATAGALRAVFRLEPAAAMRPPAPPAYRHFLFARGSSARVPAAWMMVLREASARPFRSALTLFGVAVSVPLVVMSLFWGDAIDLMIDVQFAAVERGDAVVTFVEPAPTRAVRAVARLPGVLLAEPMRAEPAVLRTDRDDYRTAVVGLPAESTLRRLLDADLRPVAVPAAGLVLSSRLAERLHLRVGDPVEVEILRDRRPVERVTVTGLVDDLIGLSAYMSETALARMMRDSGRAGSVSVRLDPRAEAAFQAGVLASPRIASLGIKSLAVENFRRSTGAVVTMVASVFALFAVSIAFGVVYNNVRIALQEKSRELATLRIIGFTRLEVARLLFASSAIELAVGIPLGLVLGYHWVRILVLAFETEMFRIPPIVAPASYLWSALAVAVAGFVSMAIVGRRLARLDMIGVLKERD